MRAAVEREAAAQGVAGHGDVAGTSVQRGEPVCGSSRDDIAPQRAADHAGRSRGGIDRDAGQLVHPDQHGVGERPVREHRGAVAGALRRDAHAEPGRSPDDARDLVGRAGDGDGGWALHDREVPRDGRRLVAGIAGQEHRSGPAKRRGVGE
nr:hypothetical protein [Agromyces marinus]